MYSEHHPCCVTDARSQSERGERGGGEGEEGERGGGEGEEGERGGGEAVRSKMTSNRKSKMMKLLDLESPVDARRWVVLLPLVCAYRCVLTYAISYTNIIWQ